MWPLLKRDGLGVQYVVLTILWNAALGYTPFKLPKTLCQFVSLVSYSVRLVSRVFLNDCFLYAGYLGRVYRASPLGTCHPTSGSVPRPLPGFERPGQYPNFW